MKRADHSLTIALCASLTLHAAWSGVVVNRYVAEYEYGVYLPGWRSTHLNGGHRLTSNDSESRDDGPKPMPILIPQVPDEPPPERLFGQRGGKGSALNSSQGEQEMLGMASPDAPQAFLNKNPDGSPFLSPEGGRGGEGGNGGAPPSPGGSGGQPSRPGLAPQAFLARLVPPPDSSTPLGVPPVPPPPIAPQTPHHEMPLIAVADPTRPAAPTSQATDDRPGRPLEPSPVTRDDSPTTRPVNTDPATRPADPLAFERSPTTQPIEHPATRPVEIATTQPVSRDLPKDLREGQLPAATRPVDAPLPTTRPLVVALASAGDVGHPGDMAPPIAPSPGGGGAPGIPGVSGHGAGGVQSESESDPFNKEPNFIWRNGRLEVRDGRKVKTVRPKLSEAGREAAFGMEEPVVVLAFLIDEAGKVIDVRYVRKTNVNEVDLPTYRAAWEWEFEPTIGKDGKPHPDVLLIPFVFR